MGEGSEGDEGQRLLDIVEKQSEKIAELEAKLRKANDCIAELDPKYVIKKKEAEKLYAELQKSGDRIAEMQVDLRTRDRRIRDLQGIVADKKKIHDDEVRRMRGELNVRYGKIGELKAELEAANAKLTDKEKVFQGLIDRVSTMALVHGQLQQSDSGQVSMQQLATKIVSQYGFAEKGVRATIAIPEDVLLPAEQAVPCALIINELVSNCFEHAFSDGREGEITVTMKFDELSSLAVVRETRAVEFSVRNNGVELPDDFTFRDSKSLGMLIVKSLVSQIDGEYGFDTNNGTRFKIGFPFPI